MIGIIVVGAGKWGKNHIRSAYAIQALAGIVDSNPETKNVFQKQYPGIPIYASLDEPDALGADNYIVATPAETHAQLATYLLARGKNVLVEKPLALTVQEGQSLIALAKKTNCVLMVGHLLLFHPAILQMKQAITDGKLGDLQYLYSNRLNMGTVRSEENALWSFAPHDISIFDFFIQNRPLAVQTNGGAYLQSAIHDVTMTSLVYPKQVRGHIFVSWLHPFKEHRLVVIGSKGMMKFEDSADTQKLLFYDKWFDTDGDRPVKHDEGCFELTYDDAQPLQEEIKHFIQCVQGHEENNRISGEKGVRVLDVLARAQASLRDEEASFLP